MTSFRGLIFCLFIVISIGCVSKSSGNYQIIQSDKVLSYHNLVNKAELKIVQMDLDSAVYYYKLSFDLGVVPFSIDIDNALTASVLNKDYVFSKCCSEMLLDKGVDLSFFLENEKFKDFVTSDEWNSSSNCAGKSAVNKKQVLIAQLESIYEIDQKYRMPIRNHKKIIEADNENMLKIHAILNQYGYPSEKLIGVNSEDSIILGNDFDIVLLHYVQNGNLDLLDTLKYFVEQGDLHPEILARIIGTRPEYPIGLRPVFIIDGIAYKLLVGNEVAGDIEFSRESLLLPSKEEDFLKLIFENCHPKGSMFRLSSHLSMPPKMSSSDVKVTDETFDMLYEKITDCDF